MYLPVVEHQGRGICWGGGGLGDVGLRAGNGIWDIGHENLDGELLRIKHANMDIKNEWISNSSKLLNATKNTGSLCKSARGSYNHPVPPRV
jgi:hypothetical protein